MLQRCAVHYMFFAYFFFFIYFYRLIRFRWNMCFFELLDAFQVNLQTIKCSNWIECDERKTRARNLSVCCALSSRYKWSWCGIAMNYYVRLKIYLPSSTCDISPGVTANMFDERMIVAGTLQTETAVFGVSAAMVSDEHGTCGRTDSRWSIK